jgi:hypothetical protein
LGHVSVGRRIFEVWPSPRTLSCLGARMYVEAVEAAGDGLGSLCRDRRAFYYHHLHTSHISLFNDRRPAGCRNWRRFWRPAGRPFPPPLPIPRPTHCTHWTKHPWAWLNRFCSLPSLTLTRPTFLLPNPQLSSPRRPYASGREQPNLAPSTILAKMYFRASVLPSRQRATPLAVFPLITPSSLRLLLPSIPSASPSFFSRWNPPGGDSIHPARLLSFTLFTPCLVCSSSTSTCTSLIEPHSPYGPAPTG